MAEAPGDRLPDRPAARPLAVEAELRDEVVEAGEDVAARMTELPGSHDRCDAELALAHERLRVDRQPRLPLRGEHVVAVQVLVEEHLLALRPRQLLQRLERGVEQGALEGPAEALPRLLERVGPPGGLCCQRPERRAGGLPEPRQQLHEDVQRGLSAQRRERRPRHAALEQQRVLLRLGVEQPDRAVAVPELECGRLVLALAVWLLHLQNGPIALRRRHRRDELRRKSAHERLAEGQPPARDQTLAGQRYASAWRFFSEGSLSRTERSSARSSVAVITVSSSGACASTIPHGSTMSERP